MKDQDNPEIETPKNYPPKMFRLPIASIASSIGDLIWSICKMFPGNSKHSLAPSLVVRGNGSSGTNAGRTGRKSTLPPMYKAKNRAKNKIARASRKANRRRAA